MERPFQLNWSEADLSASSAFPRYELESSPSALGQNTPRLLCALAEFARSRRADVPPAA
jgi:hypothetical protein